MPTDMAIQAEFKLKYNTNTNMYTQLRKPNWVLMTDMEQ